MHHRQNSSSFPARQVFQIEQSRTGSKRALAGTLLLNNVPINILFDTDTSILVISLICPSSLNLPIIHLSDAYMIWTMSTQYLVSNESTQGCILSLGSHQVQSNLSLQDTPTYDVILGMDWLTKNDVQIDCARQHILFSSDVIPLSTSRATEKINNSMELAVLEQTR